MAVVAPDPAKSSVGMPVGIGPGVATVRASRPTSDSHVATGEEVSKQFAERAKPCFGTLEDSGGQYCSTLYTDSEDDELTVDDIKKIIHPLNWDICLPTFFHKMVEQSPGRFTADGWYRIVESISA